MDTDPFIRQFPEDPEAIRTLRDIEKIERVPVDKRFPCRSTRDALMETARRQPDDVALSYLSNGSIKDEPRCWTYKEYLSEVVAAANVFRRLGVDEGSSVAILLPNIPEMLFAIWGAELAGIAAPINPFLSHDQIAGIVHEANARVLVTLSPAWSEELWNKVRQVRELVPGIVTIIMTCGPAGDEETGCLDWAQEMSAAKREQVDFERTLDGHEIASYFHTGGTTGQPKLAQRTHRAEVVNVCQMLMTGPQTADYGGDRRVILCGLPLFHSSAYIAGALSAIIQGAELILAGPSGFRNKTLIQDFWPLVERYRVTFFAVVPTVYAALLDQPSEGYDLSSLRIGGSGGAPMSVNLLREFRDRTGADIIEGYGMTESTACATTHTFSGDRKLGSVGIRLPYLKVRIVELGEDCAVQRTCESNEIGSILLSGPNVISSYKQAVSNKGAWPEPGWLNTGDMGRVDDDGYYWITGRKKDLIIRGGHNIDPAVTEESLSSHPAVAAVAAVGKPDSYAGELPVAYVMLHPGTKVPAADLVDYARQHCTERAASPVDVFIWDALPTSAVGKVLKPGLRKDAIARVYGDVTAQVLGTNQVYAETVDDSSAGLCVQLWLDDAAKGAHEENVSKLMAALDAFAYKWDVGYRPTERCQDGS